MNPQQRFCPLCDRSFQEGEAVLRCEGCGVLHHPGCWVTNAGCATQAEHRVAPQAMAYTTGARPPGAPAPHPGEGTRSAPTAPPPAEEAPAPIPFRQPGRPHPLPPTEERDDGAIGATPEVIHRRPTGTVVPPAPPRRYVPPAAEHLPRKPLPRIYERHRLFAYWYVPAAAALAIVVALGVIWTAGRLFGGGDSEAGPGPAPPASATTASPAGTSPPASTVTPPATSSVPPSPVNTTGPGKFTAGDILVVTGTGDCLNVRTNPGIENDAIICIADATEVKVTGGPRQAGGLTWWKVETRLGEGWAAEDYLVKKP